VCEQSTEKGQLEEQCLQATLFSSSDYADQVGGNKELTTVLMKMFALACKADREFRATEIASLLPNSQTVRQYYL
jgi:chromosome transmission fidelity protein 4